MFIWVISLAVVIINGAQGRELYVWTTRTTVSGDTVNDNSTAHLFKIEDVIVEVILQLLICIVYTELLKAVGLKILKAKNVQDANRQTLKNRTINTK